MQLKDCTKEELIWVIDQIKARSSNREEIDYIILKLNCRKTERQLTIYIDSLKEYGALLSPYKERQNIDIPLNVIKKARAALKRAEYAHKKWKKLCKWEEEQC